MSDQARGLLITLVGVLFVVPDSLFIRLIDAPAFEISFWRNGTAGALLLAFVYMRGGTRPLEALKGAGRYGVFYTFVIGVTGVLFTLAVSLTSVANVVFIIASMPVFAALFSWFALGERVSRRMVLTMMFVFLGLGLILYGSGETEGASLAGDALALCVSALFAAGLTAARKAKGVSMVPLVPVGYLASAIVLWPFVAPFELREEQIPLVVLHGAYIMVSSIGLALGPRYIPSAEVALLILLESVLAPLLVWVWLGEAPSGSALAGGAVVIAALAVSNAVALMRRQRAV